MRSALLVVAAAAALAAPSSARACIAVNDTPITDVLPEPGAVDVPTNAVIWADQSHASLSLVDPKGAVVTTRQNVLSGHVGGVGPFVTTLRPSTALAPQATYRVMDGGKEISRFTTGAGPDTEAPPPPKELGRTQKLVEGENSVFGVQTKCGPSSNDRVAITFTLEHSGLVAVASREAWAPAADSFAAAPNGEVDSLSVAGSNTLELTFQPGEKANVVFGTFDAAGNFSGWSAPVAVEAQTSGFGCSAAPGNLAPMALALLGLALGFRVRR